jgi:hypothetical protein
VTKPRVKLRAGTEHVLLNLVPIREDSILLPVKSIPQVLRVFSLEAKA